MELRKIRNRALNKREICVELHETPEGFLDFAVNNISSEIPHDIILLGLLAESPTKLGQRKLAKRVGSSLGKLNGLIKSLTEEGLYDKRQDCGTPFGHIQLHQYFPEVFSELEGYREYTESLPFKFI